MSNLTTERGDTLVEVLLSMAILSLVIVGASTLMNLGMRNAINSVEHTQVRNVIVGQGELLHYLRDNASEVSGDVTDQTWEAILDNGNAYVNAAPPTPVTGCTPNARPGAFYLTLEYSGSPTDRPEIEVEDYDGTITGDTPPYAVPGQGMWIEGVASQGVTPEYIDFHIRACWQGIGTDVDQQSSSVVRLYMR